MTFKASDCFAFEVGDDQVARLRFTRPELHNRFDEQMHSEFPELLLEIWRRNDIRAMILSADGKSFSAGGDLNMMLAQNSDKKMRDRIAWEAKIIYGVFAELPFPVIAAVQGAAIGLGATILAMSDIVVACEAAKIADPHVQLGLVAGDGGVIGWSQSIGVNRAKRYLLTGERISGRLAYEMGLVTDLVNTPEEVVPKAEEIAQMILALPKGGVEGTKRTFAKYTQQLSGPVFELGLTYEMECLAGPEVRDTVTAILEKS